MLSIGHSKTGKNMIEASDSFTVGLTSKQKAVAAKCTPLEREFVCKWLALGCDPSRATEALISAYGDAVPDVKDSALKKRAQRMASKESVNDFIDVMREHSFHHAIMEKEEAMLLLSLKARAHIADAMEWSEYIAGYDDDEKPVYQTAWRLKNAEDLPAYIKCAIKSLSVTSDGRPKIEFHDSNSAKRLLAEMQGWKAPTKTEHTGKDGAPLGDMGLSETEIRELLDNSTKKILEAL